MPTCHVCGSLAKPLFQQHGYDFWACTACGLECISPQPDDGALANIYRESYYDAWGLKESQASVKHLKQGSFSQYLQILGELRPGIRLLDCGAATGFLAELARAQGLDAYAIELSAFGAEACRTLIGSDHVYEGEVEGAWFPANPENRFDIITMIDFLEHVRHPRAVLQWAAARLRPGGSLLLVTPWVGSLSHRLMGQRWTHYKVEHLWYFTPRSLTTLLSEVGFSLAKLQPAYKKLSLDYAIHQFRVYPHPVISPVLFVLDRLFPRATKSLRFALPLGEMLVHAVVKLPKTNEGI